MAAQTRYKNRVLQSPGPLFIDLPTCTDTCSRLTTIDIMSRLSLLVVLLFSVSISGALGQMVVQYRPGECLPGDKHKELTCPEPEGPDYEYCRQWSNQTCCTAEFTKQLAGATVESIEGFRWDRCGSLSDQCEEYFKRIECFYRCSPNIAHWQGAFPSSLNNLPICREFCDNWFAACATDLTCAADWIFDFDVDANGVNTCKVNSTCRNFTELYTDGQGLCETLWGDSFIYSNNTEGDPNRQCMTMYWPEGEPNPNVAAIRNIFGADIVDTVTPAPCAGAHGLVSHILPLLAVAVFLTALVL